MGRKRRSPRVKIDGSESDEDFTRFFVCISLTSTDNVVTCRYYRSKWVLTFFVRKMSLEDIVVGTNLRPLSDSPFWLIDRVADRTGGSSDIIEQRASWLVLNSSPRPSVISKHILGIMAMNSSLEGLESGTIASST